MSIIFNKNEDKIQKNEALVKSDTINDKYIAVGIIGLINSITKKWVDTGMKETPEEMINFLMSFLTKIV